MLPIEPFCADTRTIGVRDGRSRWALRHGWVGVIVRGIHPPAHARKHHLQRERIRLITLRSAWIKSHDYTGSPVYLFPVIDQKSRQSRLGRQAPPRKLVIM